LLAPDFSFLPFFFWCFNEEKEEWSTVDRTFPFGPVDVVHSRLGDGWARNLQQFFSPSPPHTFLFWNKRVVNTVYRHLIFPPCSSTFGRSPAHYSDTGACLVLICCQQLATERGPRGGPGHRNNIPLVSSMKHAVCERIHSRLERALHRKSIWSEILRESYTVPC
jgi:hypothetical protein